MESEHSQSEFSEPSQQMTESDMQSYGNEQESSLSEDNYQDELS